MGNTENRPKIFIAHGHDIASKEALARIIESEGFKAIILNEQLDGGKTIIEKLEDYTNVTHAFIIYTACDEGMKKDSILEPRARQNVVFEHGFLMGKLGRKNTTVLYEEGVVEPSDINGLGYTLLDSHEAWKSKVKEILKDIKTNKKENKQVAEKVDKAEEKVKYIKKQLEKLDYEEKANLREFFCIHGKNTIEMPTNDPTVSGLLKRGVLYITSINGRIEPLIRARMFNCSINQEYEEYIDDKVLGLPMSEEELAANRPEWVYKYQTELSKKSWLYR